MKFLGCNTYVRNKKIVVAIVYLFLLSWLSSVSVFAQSISLSHVQGVFSDNGDYFSDELNRPRDMNSLCDFLDDQHYYSTKIIANSIWSGSSNAKTGPVFSVSHVPLEGTALPFIPECGETTFSRPIDASRYQLFSVKSKLSSATTYSALLWNIGRSHPIFGGFMTIGLALGSPRMLSDRWAVNWFSLPGNPAFPQGWQGILSGISFAPAVPFSLNARAEIDWLRLVNLNNSNWINLRWVSDANGIVAPRTSLYADNDSSDYNGTVVFEGENVSAQRDIPLGMLPPGTYYFYARLENKDGVAVRNSNYIGPIVINAKPQVIITAPSMQSGAEYARDERRDEWDFSSLGDMVNVPFNGSNPPQSFRYFSDYMIQDGIFYATSDRVTSQVAADVQVHPTVLKQAPIKTSIYRYVCTRMQIDSRAMPRDGDPKKLNDAGWFARVMYFNSADTSTFGSTRGFHVYETSTSFPDVQNGFLTYCLDLWDPNNHDTGKMFNQVPSIDVFRFDPHEAFDPTRFAIDHIGLYSENITEVGETYVVKWQTKDVDNNQQGVKIYLDTDTKDFNGSLVADIGLRPSGQNQHRIDLSAFPEGYYYVYVEVFDGFNTTRVYSNTPIKKTPQKYPIASTRVKTPCDIDGDAKTDFVLVRSVRNSAQWLSLSSVQSAQAQFWGFTNQDVFIDTDYDADYKLDKLALRKSAQYQWWIQRSSGPISAGLWGHPGDFPLVSDFDGDGASDTTIFRESDGSWWSILSAGGIKVEQWGLPGDIPVHADYDGDAISDYAIWRPAIGFWAVRKSSTADSVQEQEVIWKQWGLSDDLPMTGDYTGDGVADLVVWRPQNGTWYICPSDSGFNCSQPRVVQFGLPGDYPVSADIDADRILDLVVFRPKNGTWYMRNGRTGVITTRQYGLSGDYPVCTSNTFIKQFTR